MEDMVKQYARYNYLGRILRIVDGDTIDVMLDLGLKIYVKERVRLAYIDTPEIYGPKAKHEREAGLKSSARVKELVPEGSEIKVVTMRDTKGKFGRYLALIYPMDSKTSINQTLLDEGLAKPYGK